MKLNKIVSYQLYISIITILILFISTSFFQISSLDTFFNLAFRLLSASLIISLAYFTKIFFIGNEYFKEFNIKLCIVVAIEIITISLTYTLGLINILLVIIAVPIAYVTETIFLKKQRK